MHMVGPYCLGIASHGPVDSWWMYVYERMNSWICRRVTNRRHPEANVMETYRVSGISVVALPTCTYTHVYVMLQYRAGNWQAFGDKCIKIFCIAVQSILFRNKQNSTSVHMCIVYYRINVEMFHFKVTALQQFYSTNLYCLYRKSILPTPYIPPCKKLGFKLRNRLLLIFR